MAVEVRIPAQPAQLKTVLVTHAVTDAPRRLDINLKPRTIQHENDPLEHIQCTRIIPAGSHHEQPLDHVEARELPVF